MNRSHNFSAGPGAIPLEVLTEAAEGLLDFTKGCGVQEISHRSKEFLAVRDSALFLLRKLLKVPDNYKILLCQGGATMQFTWVPINLMLANKKFDYVDTGIWAHKAAEAAKKLGYVHIAASSRDDDYKHIPTVLNYRNDTSYLHITSNNTVYGTQFRELPKCEVPLVVDMSSDILSRDFSVSDCALIYAGAQKNLGPSGVVVVIVREDLLDRVDENTPDLFQYKQYIKQESLYNTPPTFGFYLLDLMLKWVDKKGGVPYFEKLNVQKADLIYSTIDKGFYVNKISSQDRSLMNIIFSLPTEDLTSKFIEEAEAQSLVNLKGYRTTGGIRASIYNSCSLESCQVLADFMRDFAKKNG